MDLRSQLPRLQALFDEALSYPEGLDREAFLNRACGDDAGLRREVARVIDGYKQASAAFPSAELLPRFGPYQALRLIGRGGMGAVYLAERADGEFSMQVAIKVVAGTFLSPVLEDNFRRERQILANLNHPNIARLLDGGVENGTPFLVMEYVDGQQLDDYCQGRNLDAARRIELLCAVCEAVEYAHSAGVVHRDLKPSNILVTSDGGVKLLDFGSSKLIDPQVLPGHTVTALRGVTPGYASPEQMEGRSTGPPTDIYSLGILLARLCPGDPMARRVAERAARREPERRQPSVAAFRRELEQLLSPGARRRRWAPFALAWMAVCLLLAGFVWHWQKSRKVAANDERYIRLNPPGTRWRNATVSADGQWLAYSSDQEQNGNYDIWLRRLDQAGKGQRLTAGPERDEEPTLSPDGGMVAFYANRQPPGIYRLEVATGIVRLIAPGGHTPKYSPDGRWIAYSGSARIIADMEKTGPTQRVKVIPAAGGDPVDVSAGLPASAPIWSPDGSELFFIAIPGNQFVDVWSVPAGASLGVPRMRQKSDGRASWIPCAGLENGLAVTDFTTESSKTLWVGNLADPAPPGFGGDIRDCSAAPGGQMIVEGVETHASLWSQPLDPDTGLSRGDFASLRGTEFATRAPSLSWDGKRLIYSNSDSIVVEDLSAGSRISYPAPQDPTPLLSGDGLVLWSAEKAAGVVAKRIEPGGVRRDDRTFVGFPWSTNNDGHLLLVTPPNSRPRTISLIERDLNRETVILSHPQFNLYNANFAPDDHWLVFEAETAAGWMVYAAPFQGPHPIPQTEWISLGAGEDPKWAADGKSVYVLSEADGFSCVWRVPVDGATKRPTRLPEAAAHFHEVWSPRFLMPGLFRIAAARDKLMFLLGEQDEIVWRRNPPARF